MFFCHCFCKNDECGYINARRVLKKTNNFITDIQLTTSNTATAYTHKPILCSLPGAQPMSPHPLFDISSHIFSTDIDSFQLLSLLLILCPVWTVFALIKLSSQLLMFQLMSLAARQPFFLQMHVGVSDVLSLSRRSP